MLAEVLSHLDFCDTPEPININLMAILEYEGNVQVYS